MENALWKTYDVVRKKLAAQYERQDFNPETGLTVEQLRQQLEKIIDEPPQQPRILIRARALALILRRAQLRVDPEDWFADHINHGRILFDLQARWRKESADAFPPCIWVQKQAASSTLDLSHTSPNWKDILKLGLPGLKARAQRALEQPRDQEGKDFLQAVVIVYDAAMDYVRRLAEEARRVNAQRVIDVLDATASHAPKTFHQALQLAYIYHQIQEIEGEYVRSQGTFDQLFFPFYQQDLKQHRITREQAGELLDFFFEKFASQHFSANHNFCFGGRTPDGRDLTNPLTDLALERWLKRGDIDPKFSFRWHPNAPRKYMDFLARAIKTGHNPIIFANDQVAYSMFVKQGKEPEEVMDFVPIGCYEPAIMGKELCCSMSALINLAKIPEFMFQEPQAPTSFQEVKDRAHRLLGTLIKDVLELAKIKERTWPQVNPSPFMSGTFHTAIQKQRDISHGGTKYSTSGVMCAGLATLVDSLAAIRYAVFQRKLVTWQQLGDILENNWKDQDKLRRTIWHKAPKYGNNDPDTDQLAVEFAQDITQTVNQTKNSKGNTFQCGLWSIDHFIDFGKQTGATPDGRFAQAPISKNLEPTTGTDLKGVTATLLSVAKLPHDQCPDGNVIGINLHPSLLMGPEGHRIIVDLITTYFNHGGFFIHFNVLDSRQLREAQKDPERYRNLQVRVCGWNAPFVSLPKDSQDAFIREAESI